MDSAPSEPRFAHAVERELAAVFDELGLVWEYEPDTFVLERDEEGFVTEAFTPDFYLPEQDVYVECTTMRQRLTARKNRKVRGRFAAHAGRSEHGMAKPCHGKTPEGAASRPASGNALAA